jgi:hypothetical protein
VQSPYVPQEPPGQVPRTTLQRGRPDGAGSGRGRAFAPRPEASLHTHSHHIRSDNGDNCFDNADVVLAPWHVASSTLEGHECFKV